MFRFFTNHWVSNSLRLPKNAMVQPFTSICTDTRKTTSGCLFFALQGEKVDGHSFIEEALRKGATGVVHSKEVNLPANVESFAVSDVLEAYRSLAGAWRGEFKIPVLAVAGSAGKTTTKELLAALLRGKFKNVLSTEGSQNGFQGIPATLFRLNAATEIAVIEVGIDEPHAMVQHLQIVQPTAGVLSSIGEEHLEKLIDLNTVEKEEGELFQALNHVDKFIAVNVDDARIAHQATLAPKAARLFYSLHGKADLSAKYDSSRDLLVITSTNAKPVEFVLPVLGTHGASNFLGAYAMALSSGVTYEQMKEGLKTFRNPPGRNERKFWRECEVIFDCYNANPASTKAALESIPEQKGHVWICLGDMLELGANEEGYHRALADPMQGKSWNVLLFGKRMASLNDELARRAYKGTVRHFATQEELAATLQKEAQAGDFVLLKGSRGMKMEKIWEILSANP